MNINDKVHIDPAILISVLAKNGVALGRTHSDTACSGGVMTITTTTDAEGQLLCERGDDTRQMREVRYDSYTTPLLIPQETQTACLDWETLYPRAHWPAYALRKYHTYYFNDFFGIIETGSVRVGLCKNKHRIIDVSAYDPTSARVEYNRLLGEHGVGGLVMYGVSNDARLVSIASPRELLKPLFICIY